MKRVTRTIKLKFPQLNKTKEQLFEEMTALATDLANWLLTIPLAERRKLTTSKVQTRLMSALSNQVIRHTTSDAGKKAKFFKRLPPEVNNQNWALHKVGTTYSVSFPTIKGTKRVPVEVASKHWQPVLEGILDGTIERDSAKIIKHRNKWYVYVSVTEEVPQVDATNKIGCDRGQNNLAVVAPKNGFGKFFSGKELMCCNSFVRFKEWAVWRSPKLDEKLIHGDWGRLCQNPTALCHIVPEQKCGSRGSVKVAR